MSLYYEGYSEARQKVFEMSREEMLDYIAGLWGTENLPDNFTLEELRNETLDQVRREFTDTSSKEHEVVDFYTKLYRAMKEIR